MVFSSLLFLYIFLPVSVGIYYCVKGITARNIVLIVASLVFYAWGQPLWAVLMLLTGAVDYGLARMMDNHYNEWQARAGLFASLIFNLGILGIFRYMDMIVEALNAVPFIQITAAGYDAPVGLAIYTLTSLTYVIDVYRGRARKQGSFINYMMYVSLFPRLMAGPIGQYSRFLPSMEARTHNMRKLANGLTRFIIGLGKVVLLAKPLSDAAVALFEGDLNSLSMLGGWLGALLFGLRVYFTLSGYSDMALGMGRMFGFEFDENFEYPSIAISITEYFSRFYISAMNFFNEYVYEPLGGDMRGGMRNLLIMWMLIGLFFGASWNMLIWGLYIGGLCLLERYVLGERLLKWPTALRTAVTLIMVTLGWALFYFADLNRLGHVLSVMLGFSGQAFSAAASRTVLVRNIFLIIAAIIASMPFVANFTRDIMNRLAYAGRGNLVIGLNICFNLVVLILCTAMLVSGTYNPFVYLQG